MIVFMNAMKSKSFTLLTKYIFKTPSECHLELIVIYRHNIQTCLVETAFLTLPKVIPTICIKPPVNSCCIAYSVA